MKILHYSLGFPPYRSGGMTIFCLDLMKEQKKRGCEVALLWPGEIKLFNKKPKIVKRKSKYGIESFELINPLPIPLDRGVVRVDEFIKKTDGSVFEQLIRTLEPDIIHIHTFMGLYKELLVVARDMGIRIVFTSHDYYPICPRLILCKEGCACNKTNMLIECLKCNKYALSMFEIFVMQSPIYRKIKESSLGVTARKWRKRFRTNDVLTKECMKDEEKLKNGERLLLHAGYTQLREFYYSMMLLVDCVHFNSNVARDTYLEHMTINEYRVIPISNEMIRDNRKEKKFGNELVITYLGTEKVYKGFYLLKQALDILWKENKSFKLNIFFQLNEIIPYVYSYPRYKREDLNDIMDSTDVVIVPSMCRETFGYVVMEALSYGVPVLLSENVGAKDYIAEGCAIVLKQLTVLELVESIKKLTPSELKRMNCNILNKLEIITVESMANEIEHKCYCG